MNIKKLPRQLMLSAAFVALMAALPASAADGDKSTVKGLITAIQGDTVTIRDVNNAQTTITLLPTTTYKLKKGLVGARWEKVERGALITGLPIIADVVAAGAGLNASAISFESEEMRNAQQVQAGMASTQSDLATTQARVNDFGSYEALATADVLFDTGSTTISATGKSDLTAIAEKTKGLKDYRIVVQGFTDSTGDAAANQKLSKRRAAAVTDFLQQQGGVSPGRVQEGDGMGVAADAGTGSNAGARKVVVKLVVDKGVNGGTK